MDSNMKHLIMGNEAKVERGEIWQQKGYCSTDCGEENDEKTDKKKSKEAKAEAGDEDDEEYYYYDEEDDDEAEEVKGDPAALIEKEREDLKIPEIERQLVA